MIGIDTNILIYARIASAPLDTKALAFVTACRRIRSGEGRTCVDRILHGPAQSGDLAAPLDATSAAAECQHFRSHPHWALAENAEVMGAVWQDAAMTGFARRRIIDIRMARRLLAHILTEFATVNERDFQGLGFARVWNPLV